MIMKILNRQDAGELLGGISLDVFIAKLTAQLKLVEGTYSAPFNSGVQIALSRLFAYLMFKNCPIFLNITGWGIATEQLDLFDGYRRSLGETRSLMEAPVHFFERSDEEVFISLLCMVLFFSWDASIFDITGRFLLQTSHDGWLEIRTNDGVLNKEVATELEIYKISLLTRA